MEVTLEMIKELREITHAGIMDCKRALQKSNGNFAEAEKYLKEVGLAAVEKRVDRATDNGRVTFMVTDKKACMVDVSCETDFVAKNDQFKELGQNICKLTLEKGYTEPTDDMQDLCNGLIATINENMKVKKVISFDVPENNTVVSYSHADGLIGVLVQFSSNDKAIFADPDFKTFSFNTAMHVCAASPMFLDDTCVPKDYEEEQLSIFKKQVEGMDKPEKVLQGIVMGKLKKLYSEICLMDQNFQINNDDNLSVKQLVAKFNKEHNSNIAIVRYERFHAGA